MALKDFYLLGTDVLSVSIDTPNATLDDVNENLAVDSFYASDDGLTDEILGAVHQIIGGGGGGGGHHGGHGGHGFAPYPTAYRYPPSGSDINDFIDSDRTFDEDFDHATLRNTGLMRGGGGVIMGGGGGGGHHHGGHHGGGFGGGWAGGWPRGNLFIPSVNEYAIIDATDVDVDMTAEEIAERDTNAMATEAMAAAFMRELEKARSKA